jgi:hypothetical protein
MRWLLLSLIMLAALTFGGCEVVGGIFKAGVWVGVLVVVLVLFGIGLVAAKMRR